LELINLTWLSVKVFSNDSLLEQPRFSHVSVIFDSKLIIFGGINQKGYLNGSLTTLELS